MYKVLDIILMYLFEAVINDFRPLRGSGASWEDVGWIFFTHPANTEQYVLEVALLCTS